MQHPYVARFCEACPDTNFGRITSDLALWKLLHAEDRKEESGQIPGDGTIRLAAARLAEWHRAADCFDHGKCLPCSPLPDRRGGCIAHSAASHGKCRFCSELNRTSLPLSITMNDGPESVDSSEYSCRHRESSRIFHLFLSCDHDSADSRCLLYAGFKTGNWDGYAELFCSSHCRKEASI